MLPFEDPFLNTTCNNTAHLILIAKDDEHYYELFRENSVALFYPVQKWFVKCGAQAAAVMICVVNAI